MITGLIGRFAVVVLLGCGVPLMAQVSSYPQYTGKTVSAPGGLGAGMSDGAIGSGLKEALATGTERAVKTVAKPGGYLENAEIKILLPPKLEPMEKVARKMGQGDKIDEFVASMNHAAESAAPEAAHVFGDAVRAMTIDDARKLLNGGDTSITDYFRQKTSADLATAFRPHVEQAMSANGVTEKYNALAGGTPTGLLGHNSGKGFDVTGYVVQKALDGLFVMLAKEEKTMRSSPTARSTALLRKMFQ